MNTRCYMIAELSRGNVSLVYAPECQPPLAHLKREMWLVFLVDKNLAMLNYTSVSSPDFTEPRQYIRATIEEVMIGRTSNNSKSRSSAHSNRTITECENDCPMFNTLPVYAHLLCNVSHHTAAQTEYSPK